MALTEHYYTKFYNSSFYHIYNRSVDKKPMFKNDGNYEFFLNKYFHYLSPVLNTYAYCLLGNHFHLLVRISSDLTTSDLTTSDLTTFHKLSNLSPSKSTHDIVSHQFRKFFQSYAMAFNKQQNRTGTLFQTPFKRALVDSDTYFIRLVYYIHANPQLHGLIDDFTQWEWSSYNSILCDNNNNSRFDNFSKVVKSTDVINWFGSREIYKKYHSENQKMIDDEKYILEIPDLEIPDLTT